MEAAPKRVLTPAAPREIVSNDGGSYYAWNPNDLPMLKEANIGAAKLTLNAGGFALPAYSDSAKVAYVIQGKGRAGILLPEAPSERVIAVAEGDSIALPFGVVTWYFNDDNAAEAPLEILFLGDTSKGHRQGQFTDFALAGAQNGLFHGFSRDFVARAWDLSPDEVEKLLGSQKGSTIVKLKPGVKLPEVESQTQEPALSLNCLKAPLDVDIKDGGRVVVLTPNNLPLVKDVGLGADLVRIDGHSMCSPGFSSDSAYQVTYILRGSGRAQVVGIDGERVLDTEAKGGLLFIVPRFHVVSKIAGPEGMHWFSIITTPSPVFSHLGGKTSVWKALSKETLMAAFDVDEATEQNFRSKRMQDAIFFAPPKTPSSS